MLIFSDWFIRGWFFIFLNNSLVMSLYAGVLNKDLKMNYCFDHEVVYADDIYLWNGKLYVEASLNLLVWLTPIIGLCPNPRSAWHMSRRKGSSIGIISHYLGFNCNNSKLVFNKHCILVLPISYGICGLVISPCPMISRILSLLRILSVPNAIHHLSR